MALVIEVTFKDEHFKSSICEVEVIRMMKANEYKSAHRRLRVLMELLKRRLKIQ